MWYYSWRHVNKYLLQSDKQLIADPSSDTTKVQLSKLELNWVTYKSMGEKLFKKAVGILKAAASSQAHLVWQVTKLKPHSTLCDLQVPHQFW